MAGWGVVNNPFGHGTAEDTSDAPRSNTKNPWAGTTDIPLDDEPAPASARQTFPTGNSTWQSSNDVVNPKKDKPTSYKSSFTSYSASELAAKAQELEAREEAVRRREQELAGKAGSISRKNWPSCMPILYHDIKAEVPVWNRSMVFWAYRVWLVSALAFLFNCAIILVMAFAGVVNATWSAFFVAVIATGIGLPLSFFFWYRRLYYAAQTDGNVFKYVMFLLLAFLHLLWCFWVIASVPGIGKSSAGLFNYMFKLMGKGGNAAVYTILVAVNIALWALAAIGTKVTIARGIMALRSHDRPRLDYERRTGQAYLPA